MASRRSVAGCTVNVGPFLFFLRQNTIRGRLELPASLFPKNYETMENHPRGDQVLSMKEGLIKEMRGTLKLGYMGQGLHKD